MTVGELIEVLKGFPASSTVIVSSDAEGNSFNGLDELGTYQFDGDDVYEAEDGQGDTVVVIWPV